MNVEPNKESDKKEEAVKGDEQVQGVLEPEADDKTVAETQVEQACIGPGSCLCEVREQLGLNRAKVGQQLGLTETAVKDLEKNYFDRFPSSVYVRGYLKNYAKILGESESEIIEIYDKFCEENNLDSGKSTLEPRPGKPGLSLAAKAFIGAVMLCIIAATLFFTDLV